MASGNRLEYEQRVNRVVDYVDAHLAEELSLAGLARVAAFSPFHFHRVFHAITGETLFGFIQRLRLEKAAGTLSRIPERSVLAVALDHGFSSAATFARAFRAHFGMSATDWRAGGADRWRTQQRKRGKQLRKPGKASGRRRAHTARMSVSVQALPAYPVAYIRYVGPYGPHGIPELWVKLKKWMQTHGLLTPGTLTLGVSYDDPSITAPERCRYDACVVVPPELPADRWVNRMDLAGGTCAIATFTGSAHEIEAAWDRLFSAWLPTGGYEPDDRPCIERYRTIATVDNLPRFTCELCLPVRPL